VEKEIARAPVKVTMLKVKEAKVEESRRDYF